MSRGAACLALVVIVLGISLGQTAAYPDLCDDQDQYYIDDIYVQSSFVCHEEFNYLNLTLHNEVNPEKISLRNHLAQIIYGECASDNDCGEHDRHFRALNQKEKLGLVKLVDLFFEIREEQTAPYFDLSDEQIEDYTDGDIDQIPFVDFERYRYWNRPQNEATQEKMRLRNRLAQVFYGDCPIDDDCGKHDDDFRALTQQQKLRLYKLVDLLFAIREDVMTIRLW